MLTIIPNGGRDADKSNWVTGGDEDKKDAEPKTEPKTEPEEEPAEEPKAEPDTSSKLTGASARLDDDNEQFNKMSNSEFDDYEGSFNYNDGQGLHNKDNHDKVATFLNGDDVAERDAGISAIGKIADRPHPKLTGDPVEAITGILKKAGTTPKDFLSSLKKQEDTIMNQFSDDSIPPNVKYRSAGRLQVIKQASAGLEKVFGNENSSAKSDTQSGDGDSKAEPKEEPKPEPTEEPAEEPKKEFDAEKNQQKLYDTFPSTSTWSDETQELKYRTATGCDRCCLGF